MHTHRVKVLNAADDDAVVRLVTHDFQLVFLPSDDGSFNQNFTNRARIKSVTHNLEELFHRVRNACTTTTQDVSRANDDRKTNFFKNLHGLFHVVSHTTARNTQTDFNHCLLELVAVFRSCNCFRVGANQLWCPRNSD